MSKLSLTKPQKLEDCEEWIVYIVLQVEVILLKKQLGQLKLKSKREKAKLRINL
jgi:uncharacterized protein with PhoU and TrkA domain